jgi:hypothetical protein
MTNTQPANTQTTPLIDGISEPHLAGFIITSVAGHDYYPVPCSGGEFITLVRDPTNIHDPNAIKLLNSSGTQIGFMPREVAAAFSPFLDSNQVILLGRLLRPEDRGYDPHVAQTRPPLVVWVYEDSRTLPNLRYVGTCRIKIMACQRLQTGG